MRNVAADAAAEADRLASQGVDGGLGAWRAAERRDRAADFLDPGGGYHRPRQPRSRLRRLRPRPHEPLQRPQDRSAGLKAHAPYKPPIRDIVRTGRNDRTERSRKP